MALNFLLKRSATASKRPDPASMALGEVDLNYDAGTGGLFYKNSSGGVVKVGPAEVGTTAPNASPIGSAGNSTGEFWYDTSNSVLKIYNGSSWVDTVGTSGFLPLAGGTMTGDITLSGAGVGIVFNDASTVEAISDSTSTTSSVTAASSTAVKAAYDLANGAVPSTSFLALGDLLSGTGSGTYGNLPLGTDGDVLTADSTCSGGIKWAAGGGGGGSAATPTALGTIYGCTDTVVCSTALGYKALDVNTGTQNVALGYSAGCAITTGSQNVLIGPNVGLACTTESCTLAIGYSDTALWVTGDSTNAIKPGAGIIDCANTCGTAGQVLQSTGSNSVVWATPAAGYAGYNGYIATTSGTKFNVTGIPGELGQNFAGQLNIFTTYDNGSTGGQPIIPGSNALIFLNGYNGVGTSTVQAFNTSTGTFAVESVLYPAYTDITVTFTPTVTSDRMNFYIRYLDGTGNGGPGNGNIFSSFLTIF